MASCDDSTRGLFRIGEFSKVSGVSIKALRHWDEMGLLKPAIVDSDSNYRYYRISQLQDVDRLYMLKMMGIPMSSLKAWSEEEGCESIVDFKGERYFKRVQDELTLRRDDLLRAEAYLRSQQNRYAHEEALLRAGTMSGVTSYKSYFLRDLGEMSLTAPFKEIDLQTWLSEFTQLCGIGRIGADWGIRITKRQTDTESLHVELFQEVLEVQGVMQLGDEPPLVLKTEPRKYTSTLVITAEPVFCAVEEHALEHLNRPHSQLWLHLCSLTQDARRENLWEFQYLVE